MSTEKDIETYLAKAARRDVHAALREHQRAHSVLMFGETHVGWGRKAQVLARIIRDARRDGLIHYHASEFFDNDAPADAEAVGKYLKKEIGSSELPSGLRELAPILEAARESLPNFGIVFAGSKRVQGKRRDAELFENFTSSRKLHLKAKRFAGSDKGHFFLGAAHASRVPPVGTAATTCGRLIKAGFDVYVVRVTIDIKVEPQSPSDGQMGMEFRPSEGIVAKATTDADWIDMLPPLRTVAAGKPFFAEFSGAGSPFPRLRADYGRAVFTKCYDALLHLPAS